MLANDDRVLIGATKGMRFAFRDENNVIMAEYSPFSGKETIRLNDQIISARRSFRFGTSHTIELPNSHTYTIELEAKNVFKGKIECGLYKNEKLIQKYNVYRSQSRQWPAYAVLLFVGIVIGVATSQYKLNVWHAIMACIPFVAIAMWLQKSKWEYEIAS